MLQNFVINSVELSPSRLITAPSHDELTPHWIYCLANALELKTIVKITINDFMVSPCF